MNFSVALIAKNEEKTLPRLLDSLKEFQKLGGEILLLDTGSTDNTVEVAKAAGVKVTEVGDKFVQTLEEPMVGVINNKFVAEGEEPIVKVGDRIFDYSAARNYIASLASNDMVSMPDCDEVFTQLQLQTIDLLIHDEGVDQFEYNFVFSHDQFGNEAIKFMHSKFYNRKKMEWVGVIHEVLQVKEREVIKGATEAEDQLGPGITVNRRFVGEDIIKLEHYQNQETNRSHYLTGLALDCYLHPDNDRNMHYLGRELMYTGRFKSAVRQLVHHMNLNAWLPERTQSMIYIGDCYAALGKEELAVECWNKAIEMDASRREPLMRLAEYYFHKNDHQRTAIYAAGALQIPWNNFYANFQAHYENLPHELMYWAKHYMGDMTAAMEHFTTALKYQPLNSKYLHDYRFYYTLPKISVILPTLGRPEGLERAINSIKNQNYPAELIELLVMDDNVERRGVPKRVAEGYEQSTGDYIVFASNDIEFHPDAFILAYLESKNENKALVAFNSGPVSEDEGNICEHFMIRKNFVPRIGGEIFDTDFHHVGVDNLLWAKCKKLNEATRAPHAKLEHFHFSTGKSEMDEVYSEGWKNAEEDRVLLKQKLAELDLQ